MKRKLFMSTDIWSNGPVKVEVTGNEIWMYFDNTAVCFDEEWIKENIDELMKLAEHIERLDQDKFVEEKFGETREDDRVWCDDCKKFVTKVSICGHEHGTRLFCQYCGKRVVDSLY